ncbi:MAG: shikimate dehydrogenase [Gammaproteobacteria bacterium]
MHYKLCVMGNPIEHSISPWIHDQFATELKLSVSYTRIKPEIDKLSLAVEQFRKEHGYGFNVTLPFKQDVYKISTQRSDRAKIAKSINTIMFDSDGGIIGDNTDGLGLLNDITKNLKYSLATKTILIIGAGGAVRGILQPLLSQSPNKIIIVNRTVTKAEQLALEFASYGIVTGCGFDDLKNIRADVIIDGTGFNSQIPFPETLSISEDSLSYDLKYSNKPTQFMIWANAKGSKLTVDGLGMLVEQAAEAFYIWTGQRPNTHPVIRLAKKLFMLNNVFHR